MIEPVLEKHCDIKAEREAREWYFSDEHKPELMRLSRGYGRTRLDQLRGE